jgi:hypothetical protein
MSDVITTQDMKPQCVLLRLWHLNQPIFWNYHLRAQDTLGSASNIKKSIRWMFWLRVRVNDVSDYQWGVRLSNGKKILRRSHTMLGGGQGKWALWQFCPTTEESLKNALSVSYKSSLQILPNYLSFWDIWKHNILPSWGLRFPSWSV